MARRALRGFALFAALAAGLSVAAAAEAPRPLALKVGRAHPMSSAALDNVVILVRDGRIVAIGRDVAIPEDAQVIELPDGVATPGLIDACCSLDFEIPQNAEPAPPEREEGGLWSLIGARKTATTDDPEEEYERRQTSAGGPTSLNGQPSHVAWAEQSSEVTPHRRVLDAMNFLSHDFRRLLKSGVTTVYVSPDSANVIGSQAAIVKTGGAAGRRVVRGADAVKATLGADACRRGAGNVLPPTDGPIPSLLTRRPTTRMGVEWVFRKALLDARRAAAGLPLHGADQPPPGAIPVLCEVLKGAAPLRIQARMQHDIFTALRLAHEFNLRFTLEEATEAYRCLPQLAEAGVPVVFGPLYMEPSGWRAATDEVRRPRLNTPKQLADAGIPFALTAQELRDEEGLVRQAMLAARNGLAPEQALQAITATPAKLLNLPGYGVLETDAVADVVVWSGDPLAATSRPLLVLIDGSIAYDGREPQP